MMECKNLMTERKTGKEFRESGLLWFINTILHMFGWAICLNIVTDEIYAARCKFRGFDEKSNDEGYKKVTEYMAANINSLIKDLEE
jgi:hypothetical protein